MSLYDFGGIDRDLMLAAKRFLWFEVVDDSQSIVVDLDAVRISPHFVELIISLVHYDFAIHVMLQNSHLNSFGNDIIHGEA